MEKTTNNKGVMIVISGDIHSKIKALAKETKLSMYVLANSLIKEGEAVFRKKHKEWLVNEW